MAWWHKWFGRTMTAKDQALYDLLGHGETWAGEPVSVQGAMNLSAFFAGTRIKAQTVASLSLDVMEIQRDGTKRRATDHELQQILDSSPNPDQTAIEFWEGKVLGLGTTGNAFAEKLTRSNGELVGLHTLDNDTQAVRKPSGDLVYRFFDRGKQEELPESKVFHIKGFGGGDMGMSPVAYARQSLSLTIATEKLAGQTFSKGGRSKGFFVMPPGSKPLTTEQRADAKKSLIEANSGPLAPWAGILEGGVDFKSVSLSMRDAEMILNRRFNIEDVCRWIGVLPIIIGHAAEGQTMWGTGVGQIMQSWFTLYLRGDLKRIEQAIAKRVLTPAQRLKFSVKFNYEDLLRADTAARAAFYVALLNAGVMTINEVRKLEGLPPIEGGNEARMQSQNIPITTSPDAILSAFIGHNGGPTLGANE